MFSNRIPSWGFFPPLSFPKFGLLTLLHTQAELLVGRGLLRGSLCLVRKVSFVLSLMRVQVMQFTEESELRGKK